MVSTCLIPSLYGLIDYVWSEKEKLYRVKLSIIIEFLSMQLVVFTFFIPFELLLLILMDIMMKCL